MKRFGLNSLQALVCVILVLSAAACASIGRPEGGPRDETPPVFVNSNPGPSALHVDRTRLDLYFDENVQLDDAFNKVIVSPVQQQPPVVRANGRHVTVEFRDSLQPDMTYTIDFGDAIKDLNEGNVLDGFATDFSTGGSIDSLRISGMVLEARTLEPAQGMLVGIHSDSAMTDTTLRTVPFERVARTNQLGQFTIRNLKPGTYQVFALNDINRDYKWDRTEDIAFLGTTVSPYASAITVTDTLRAHDGGDSLALRGGTAYYPNDILLSWFNEGYKAQYMRNYARPERRRITIEMAAEADSLPQIEIAAGTFAGRKIADWALLRPNATLDTLEYWITDTAVMAVDSLLLATRYRRTDSLDQVAWYTDTLKFFFKEPKQKEKKKRKSEEADTLPPQPDFLPFGSVYGSQQDVYLPLLFEAQQPLDSIDPAAVRLEIKNDTIWTEVPGVKFEPDSVSPFMRRIMAVDWTPGASYRLSVDSASVYSIYGQFNDKIKHEFTVKPLEEYANLTFAVEGLAPGEHAIVELLNTSDAPIRTAPVVDGRAVLRYLNPGDVYARLYIDRNNNGRWDTGNVADTIQPEDVVYFAKKLTLRKNWDVEQAWNIYEVPVDAQNPYAIKKNKPKLKKGERAPQDEEDDEFSDDPFLQNSGYTSNKYDSNRRTSTSRPGGLRTGNAGLRY